MCADKEETDKTSEMSADLSVMSTFIDQRSTFLPVVVYHLDGEDNHTTSERDEVGE